MEETCWVMGPEDGPSHPSIDPLRTAHRAPDFETIYRQHAPRVRDALRAAADTPADADELTHEVFVSALRRVRAGRVPADVRAWIDHLTRSALGRYRARRTSIREVPLGAARLTHRIDTRPVADLDRWIELEAA